MFTRPCSITQFKRNTRLTNMAHRGCRLPLIDAFNTFTTFFCLPLEFLQKCVESDVGDFTTPKAFHTVKVQRLKEQNIKPTHKFKCKFPVVIFALSSNFAVPTCMVVSRTFSVVTSTLFCGKFDDSLFSLYQ